MTKRKELQQDIADIKQMLANDKGNQAVLKGLLKQYKNTLEDVENHHWIK